MKPAVRVLWVALLLIGGCAARADGYDGRSVATLRLIGEQRLASGCQVDGLLAGGLSGLDYDAGRGTWIAVSDDRAEFGPPRYYTARFDFDQYAFRRVVLTAVTTLQAPPGIAWQPPKSPQRTEAEVPDLESIRIDPRDGSIWTASEGNAVMGNEPAVRHAARDGTHLFSMPLAPAFRLARERPAGSRGNQSFEGLAFAPDGHSLWLAMEAPLVQDGAVAGMRKGAPARITRLDRSGKVLAQYAYPLDPVQANPSPGRSADNGIAEILAVTADRMLVLERSGVQGEDGAFRYFIRLYQADLLMATDVSALASLDGAAYIPARKRLLLDLGTLNINVGNFEGMAWGPRLDNGRASLVLISDDNFDPSLPTQVLAFEVIPEVTAK